MTVYTKLCSIIGMLYIIIGIVICSHVAEIPGKTVASIRQHG